MRWLSSLVIFFGLLIITGLILLGYGLYKPAQSPDWKIWQLLSDGPATQPPSETLYQENISRPYTPPSLSTFGQISLNLPTECVVTNVGTYDKRMYITIGPNGDCHRIIIFDPENGRIQGTIKITQ